METLLYIGKVSLYWLLFYTCYQLFLRQQTFFVWNRLYLVGALLISFALPFLIYPESAPEIPVMYEVSLATLSINYAQPEEQFSIFTWTNVAIFSYLMVVLFRFYNMFGNIRQLNQFIRDGELVELEDCKVVLINSNDVGSFSFLKWIVVNRNDYENHFDAILRHEMVHTSQGHSFDILFVEILRAIFWFNPIMIWYKKSLQEVHEYLADEAAPNREHYASFLISYALNAPIAALTNHFFKPSQLKSRIEMIYKSRSSKWLRSSYILTFGFIGAIALLVAGCEKIKKNLSESSAVVPGQVTDSTKTIDVEGWITNAADKRAIPGANIVVEGLERGTTTDRDGRFVIKAPSYGSLIVSFNGFTTQLRSINGISGHTIALSPIKIPDIETADENQEAEPPARVDELKFQTLELPNDEKVFTVVEKQPQFPGGIAAMYKFLGENIRYPEAAARANVSGRVFLSFVVTVDGSIKDLLILKGIGFGCDEEAIRVVSSFPKWNPGTQDGTPVNVKYNLPIMFSITNDNKIGELHPSSKLDFYSKTTVASTNTPKFDNAVGAGSEDHFARKITVASNRVGDEKTLYRQSSPAIVIKESYLPLTKENQPLYVVDGETIAYADAQEMIAKMGPNKIESISVLKGLSASSIYGTKGLNGVVMINTKKNTPIAK